MTDSTRIRAFVGAIVLVPALAGAGAGLTGCGTEARSAAGDKVSVSTDKGETSVPTDQGTVAAGKELPDGFPKDAIPLIDATVVTGTTGAPGGQYAWSVVMRSPRAIDDITAEVKKDFATAGYRTTQAHEMGDVTILRFADASYRVGVTVTRTGGAVTVTYVVRMP
jgi:hypothetical protein